MVWNKARLKRQLVVICGILFCTLSTASAQEKCCSGSMWAYPSGDAVPPGCEGSKVRCTEGSIHIEQPVATYAIVWGFLSRATKTGAIIVIDNAGVPLQISNLIEIVHKGIGPAVHLKNARLSDGVCFNNLERIEVNDPYVYCENRDLLRFEGNVSKEVRDLLEKVANKTLDICTTTAAPTTVPTTVPTTELTSEPVITTTTTFNTTTGIVADSRCGQNSSAAASELAQANADRKDCPSYCSTGMLITAITVSVVLLILLAISTFAALRLFFLRKNEDAEIANHRKEQRHNAEISEACPRQHPDQRPKETEAKKTRPFRTKTRTRRRRNRRKITRRRLAELAFSVVDLRQLVAMVWNKARLKRQLFVICGILLCALSTASAQDVCCPGSMWSYPSGDAVPPGCDGSTVKCTEGSVHVEQPATKTGAIIIIDNAGVPLQTSFLKAIVHKGIGPAVHLKNARLFDGFCFNNLERIEVDNPYVYCENRDLLRFEGNVSKEVRNLLEKVANKTLDICTTTAAPTTVPTTEPTTELTSEPVITTTTTFNTTIGIVADSRCGQNSSAAASARAQANADRKDCPSYCSKGMLITAIIIIVVLLILLAISTFAALKLFFFRKNEDAEIANHLSYATQIFNLMIYIQSGRDKAMLNSIMMDRLSAKRSKLLQEVADVHYLALKRKIKFEENKPLDPKSDFDDPIDNFWPSPDAFELDTRQEMTADFIEAAQKFETIKKMHGVGKEFEPPAGTKIWSDLRMKDADKMELTKLAEQPIVERKPKPEKPKGPPKIPKRRLKGGADPPSKGTTSVKTEQPKKKENTKTEGAIKEGTKKEDPKKEDPKKEDPKKEDPKKKEDTKMEEAKKKDPKKEAPKKEGAKKEDTKIEGATNEGAKNEDPKKGEAEKKDKARNVVDAANIVVRVLKEDKPKETFKMPLQALKLKNCHPLSLTEPVNMIYDTCKSKSKILRDTFSVMMMVTDKLQRYYHIHGRALALLNKNANMMEIKLIEKVRTFAAHDKNLSSYPVFSYGASMTEQDPTWNMAFKQAVAYDELKRLRFSALPKEKRLLEMLETEQAHRSNILHAEGLNYFYWFKTFIPLQETILPGEDLGEAVLRIFDKEDRENAMIAEMTEAFYRLHPDQRPKETEAKNPPKEDKNSKEKKSKENNPKKA
ncbi:unnamed protein product [Caenorhabditis auriculariae]|uniref:Receptor L-domain domain-containing protein n=1 Tax=Caenorhabditis auriculariae TaxID=2777116 RepID=A0A8S1HBU8_9PELO|nr:unnamed protein product [Caenorhabditis auriculariae]